MAKNHFAIEPPRRINISIPGYDPKASAREQKERIARKRKLDSTARVAPQVAQQKSSHPSTSVDEVKELAAALNQKAPAAADLEDVFLADCTPGAGVLQ